MGPRHWLGGLLVVALLGVHACGRTMLADGPLGEQPGGGGSGAGPLCGAGETFCDGVCVDVDASAQHCGACDVACAAGEVCNLGVCSGSCSPGLADCGGVCVDLESDVAHCGACQIACSAA